MWHPKCLEFRGRTAPALASWAAATLAMLVGTPPRRGLIKRGPTTAPTSGAFMSLGSRRPRLGWTRPGRLEHRKPLRCPKTPRTRTATCAPPWPPTWTAIVRRQVERGPTTAPTAAPSALLGGRRAGPGPCPA